MVLGITGGIGSGKGLATEFFRRRGAEVVDADEVSREVMAAGSPVVGEVAAVFGPGLLRKDGSLDRQALAARVFGDAEAVARLNALTHPAIMEAMRGRVEAAARAGVRLVCVVAPLLLEAGGRGMVDRVLVVTAEEGERIRRVMARDGLAEEQVRARMAAQMAPEEQAREADWVVDTTAGRAEAQRQLARVWREVRREMGGD